MKLGMFMMPLHPADRAPAQTLDEDREAVIIADRLGFHDAFVGEHLTEKSENVTNSFIFLASLIHATNHIKLASGTSNLAHTHPTLVASHAAMFDHMAKGRFIFGVSAGALRSDAEALGSLDQDRNKMFSEAIDVILAIWERSAPYDIDFPDNRYKVTTRTTAVPEIQRGEMYKPYQQPRPEIVGTVVAPFSKGVITMGERDFHPLSANFLDAKWLSSHWANYAQGRRNVGATPNPADWRVARTIFVADDDRVAERYGYEEANGPYRFYWRMLRKKMALSGRLALFKNDREQPDAQITEEYVTDRLVIRGTVNKVVDQILALREQIGDFGELVYANMDWVDPMLAKRSLDLMANEVMPRVNRAIAAAAPAKGDAIRV